MLKILVVDDNIDWRSTLKSILIGAGYQVQTAANEQEAMDAVKKEPFDFAFMDLRLHEGGDKDKSGLYLAMAFRGINPGGHIFILSGHDLLETNLSVVRLLGRVDYIKKSGDWSEEILKMLKSAVDEPIQPRFSNEAEATHLHLTLALNQPVVVRAYGRHPYSDYGLKPLEIDLDSYAMKTDIARKNSEDLAFQIKDIGISMWRDIFEQHNAAYTTYLRAQAGSGPLSLVFETTPELLRLPLEFIRQDRSSQPLVLKHPIKRFLSGVSASRESISPRFLSYVKELNILIIASNTKPRIDEVDSEAQALYDYLRYHQSYIDAKNIKIKLIHSEQATYDNVKKELRKPNYDIIHYAGHGWHNSVSPDESSLFFWTKENRQGDVKPLEARELSFLLEESAARLVYLSCCFGTATSEKTKLLKDDFLGLSDAVVRAGVPTVLGYRWPVSDRRAYELARLFYESLLDQGNPDIALWSARRELAKTERSEPTWLSPILISQE
jgi:ActR/RegA family two-component response regulator